MPSDMLLGCAVNTHGRAIAHLRANRGFTLIELMVTVVIISILASFAIPSYRDYMTRGRIPDATSNLATKRVQMEQWYQDNQTYVGAGPCTADAATSQYFTFTGACAANTFTLTATGKAGMANFIFTINQSNAKATTGVPTGWTANASCWVTSKGGAC